MVYLVQLLPDVAPSRYKVGITEKIEKRMIGFRNTCPHVRLVTTWNAANDQEKLAHAAMERIGCRRIRGEVFECDDEKKVIEAISNSITILTAAPPVKKDKIRNVILARLKELQWSNYKLCKAVDPTDKKQHTIYDFLNGVSSLNSDDVAAICVALKLQIVPR